MNQNVIDAELGQLIRQMNSEGIRIIKKSNSWFRLGKNFTTTIGRTIYVPDNWDEFSAFNKLTTLTHEMVHVRQYQKFTVPWFLFLYLFMFFPIGFSFFRYIFERDAYLAGFKKALDFNPKIKPLLVQHGVEQLTGKNYWFCWLFKNSVRNWFNENL